MLEKTLKVVGFGLFSLLTVIPVYAQDGVTLALLNGERPSGELIGMNDNGLILRFDGADHPYGLRDVRTIEVMVGSMMEAEGKKDGSQPFFITRNREVFDGRLVGLEDRRPIRFNFLLSDGRMKQVGHADMGQVWVNPGAAPATIASPTTSTTTPVPANARRISVAANQQWTDTGINVRRGMRLQVIGSGDVVLAPQASSGVGGSPAITVPGARYTLRSALVGALIGRIGNGDPFLIGANTSPIDVRTQGRLYLSVNDDNYNDNSGAYTADVAIVP